MKTARIIGLGIAIWGSSWFWPGLNLILMLRVMLGVIGGLGVVELIYILAQRFGQNSDNDGAQQDHPSQPISSMASVH